MHLFSCGEIGLRKSNPISAAVFLLPLHHSILILGNTKVIFCIFGSTLWEDHLWLKPHLLWEHEVLQVLVPDHCTSLFDSFINRGLINISDCVNNIIIFMINDH